MMVPHNSFPDPLPLRSDNYLEKVVLKRLPAAPREAHTISTKSNAPETLVPIAYDTKI